MKSLKSHHHHNHHHHKKIIIILIIIHIHYNSFKSITNPLAKNYLLWVQSLHTWLYKENKQSNADYAVMLDLKSSLPDLCTMFSTLK